MFYKAILCYMSPPSVFAIWWIERVTQKDCIKTYRETLPDMVCFLWINHKPLDQIVVYNLNTVEQKKHNQDTKKEKCSNKNKFKLKGHALLADPMSLPGAALQAPLLFGY